MLMACLSFGSDGHTELKVQILFPCRVSTNNWKMIQNAVHGGWLQGIDLTGHIQSAKSSMLYTVASRSDSADNRRAGAGTAGDGAAGDGAAGDGTAGDGTAALRWDSWLDAWRKRIDAWWLALPAATANGLQGCALVLGERLTRRFERWLQANGVGSFGARGTSTGPPPETLRSASEQRCAQVVEHATPTLPDFPSFPETGLRWLVPFGPVLHKLLPEGGQLQSHAPLQWPREESETFQHSLTTAAGAADTVDVGTANYSATQMMCAAAAGAVAAGALLLASGGALWWKPRAKASRVRRRPALRGCGTHEATSTETCPGAC